MYTENIWCVFRVIPRGLRIGGNFNSELRNGSTEGYLPMAEKWVETFRLKFLRSANHDVAPLIWLVELANWMWFVLLDVLGPNCMYDMIELYSWNWPFVGRWVERRHYVWTTKSARLWSTEKPSLPRTDQSKLSMSEGKPSPSSAQERFPRSSGCCHVSQFSWQGTAECWISRRGAKCQE